MLALRSSTLADCTRFSRFQTYFPHVDNIYSHRSTQRYKRKPFISHYWDCRLKGRPPGTPKSEDPAKKKRKRNARERDLCDVKIKITEHFPRARAIEELGSAGMGLPTCTNFFAPGQPGALMQSQQQQQSQNFGGIVPSSGGIPADLPGSDGNRYYTVQRVNGSGGNGKDGTAGPHKHTLQESDRVKKNSIARHFLKIEKVKKKTQVGSFLFRLVFCVFVSKFYAFGELHAAAGFHVALHHRHRSARQARINFLFRHNPLSKQTYTEPTPFQTTSTLRSICRHPPCLIVLIRPRKPTIRKPPEQL